MTIVYALCGVSIFCSIGSIVISILTIHSNRRYQRIIRTYQNPTGE